MSDTHTNFPLFAVKGSYCKHILSVFNTRKKYYVSFAKCKLVTIQQTKCIKYYISFAKSLLNINKCSIRLFYTPPRFSSHKQKCFLKIPPYRQEAKISNSHLFSIPKQKLEYLFSLSKYLKKKVLDSYRMDAAPFFFSNAKIKKRCFVPFPGKIFTHCRISKADFIRILQKRWFIHFLVYYKRNEDFLKRMLHVCQETFE